MKYLKILGILVLIIISFLAATNPSIDEFKKFVPSILPVENSDFSKLITLSRKSNYFVYSVYEFRWNKTGRKLNFIACAGNFSLIYNPDFSSVVIDINRTVRKYK